MRKLVMADADVMRMAIQQEIARSDESRYDHRLHGLLLVTGGHSCQQVAELFGEDRRTVQRWVTRVDTHGLTGLRDGARLGRPATLNTKQWAALGRDLRPEPQTFGHAGHLWDGKPLAAHLRLRYGVALGGGASANASSATWDFGCASPDPKSPSPTRARSRRLKKLHRLARRRGVERWSVDEGHCQQHGTRCRMWVPPEIKDPVLLHAHTRKSVASFGAVSVCTGTFIRSLCATFETVLKTLLRQRSRGTRMVLVLDNARYHHAVLLKPLLRKYRAVLTLLFLSPYSPQLAPVERVRKLARRMATHNRFFATLDDVLTAVSTCFDRWRTPTSVLGDYAA